MIHLKKKRAFALAVLTFVFICTILPFTAVAEEDDENIAAVELLSESEKYDAEALTEEEATEYMEAADIFISNYSSNVSEEQEFTENLDKVREIMGDGNFGDNRPERTIKQMNAMNTEERILIRL